MKNNITSNKMSRIITLFLLFFVSQKTFAQNYGLLGRKNFVEFSTIQNIQVANILKLTFDDGDFPPMPYNYGFKFGFIHSGKKNIALGLDVHLETQQFQVRDNLNFEFISPNSQQYGNSLEMKFKRAKGLMFMPKLIFGSRLHNESVPLGFTFDIGVGLANLRSKEVELKVTGYNSLTSFMTEIIHLDKTNFNYKDLVIQFGVHNRFIITDRLIGHFALNSQLHINLKSDINITASQFTSTLGVYNSQGLSQDASSFSMGILLKKNRNFRLLNLEFGLAFAL